MTEVNEKTQKITKEYVEANYTNCYQFAYDLSSLAPGLTFSPQVVYTWINGQQPRMTSLLAILYGAERVNNKKIQGWCTQMLAALHPYWSALLHEAT